jgi:signal peptidase I
MTTIADPFDRSPDSEQPDPGGDSVQSKRGDEGRFYLGLVALVGLLVFGTLAVIAVLPMVVPGYTSASITSGSMQPKLRPGDVVIAVGNGGAGIKTGTIVVYEDPARGDLVTHRIVGVNDDGSYVTRGDANGVNDAQAIPSENVKGVGKWVVPYVGLPRVWVANNEWLPLGFTLIATVWVMWFVRYALETKYDPWFVDESESQTEPLRVGS